MISQCSTVPEHCPARPAGTDATHSELREYELWRGENLREISRTVSRTNDVCL